MSQTIMPDRDQNWDRVNLRSTHALATYIHSIQNQSFATLVHNSWPYRDLK